MRVKERCVFELALHEGVSRSINKFYKHRDDNIPEYLADTIYTHVYDAICEWFNFENEDNLL